jgi:hypothetical protein
MLNPLDSFRIEALFALEQIPAEAANKTPLASWWIAHAKSLVQCDCDMLVRRVRCVSRLAFKPLGRVTESRLSSSRAIFAQRKPSRGEPDAREKPSLGRKGSDYGILGCCGHGSSDRALRADRSTALAEDLALSRQDVQDRIRSTAKPADNRL